MAVLETRIGRGQTRRALFYNDVSWRWASNQACRVTMPHTACASASATDAAVLMMLHARLSTRSLSVSLWQNHHVVFLWLHSHCLSLSVSLSVGHNNSTMTDHNITDCHLMNRFDYTVIGPYSTVTRYCHTYCHTYYYWYSITHSLFHSRL